MPSTTQPRANVLSLAYPVPIDAARLKDLADSYAGEWFGNWAEETPGSGSVHAIIGIDPGTRSVSANFSFTGPLFQGGLGVPETLALTIPDGVTPANFDVASGIAGDLVFTYEGGRSASLSGTSLPGNNDSFSVDVLLAGTGVTASYTVKSVVGDSVFGALVAQRGTVPDPIDLAAIKAEQLTASLFSGRYAANLLTAAQASAAVGESVASIDSNGGNVNYGPGIAATNCRASTVSGDLAIQITVYRADDAAGALKFWGGTLLPNRTDIAGLGDQAFQLSQVLYLLVGHLAATIEIVHLTEAPLPIDAMAAEQAVAAAMVPQMRVAP